jgi:hypothetical protein
MIHSSRTLRSGAYLFLAFVFFAVSAPATFAAGQAHGSKNWAGYEMTGGTYTSVTGSWIVASSTPANSTVSADATWVGIGGTGGTSTDDLIQAGTQVVFIHGKPQYVAWYETLPSSQQILPLSVTPGDSVTVTISETSPNAWQITFANHTTGTTTQTKLPYVSNHASAEWIVERPLAITGETTGYLPLNNFGTLNFTNASAQTNGTKILVTDSSADQIIMSIANSTISAAPSAAANGAFSISYLTQPETASFLQDFLRLHNRTFPTSSSQVAQPVVQDIEPGSTTYIVHIVF